MEDTRGHRSTFNDELRFAVPYTVLELELDENGSAP